MKRVCSTYDSSCQRRGIVAVFTVVILVVLLGMTALSVDVGYLYNIKAELQTAADAAALAGASQLPNEPAVTSVAQEYAGYNHNSEGVILADTDVALGNWDSGAGVFTTAGVPVNAVHVIVRRSEANNNAVQLFFASILGIRESNVSAEAIALRSSGPGTRFLIDNEMIDSDVPAIEQLAASLGKAPNDIINDLDGDWFIDLPSGVVLELPTGQVGDEGLFDIGHPEFPFSETSVPSHTDFLNYNEDGSWRDDPAVKALLDPLVGVSMVSDASVYPSYVNPEFVHISPVYYSDVGPLNPVGGGHAVNALGLRRGLLAFKVLAVGADPDGPEGSVLPNLVIEIVDPALVNLNTVTPDGARRLQLVF